MGDIITLANDEFGPFTGDGPIHLNHAGIAPWPRRTHKAVQRFAAQNRAGVMPDYAGWEQTAAELRKLAQHLVNADSAGEIAFIKNTSEGLSLVAHGIDWRRGDNIVFGQQEFPSNRIVWEAVGRQFDVELRCIDLSDSPEQALIGGIDSHTRLLAVSSVQYATGRRINLEMLGAACRKNNVLFCIDAIQSLGAVPFDAQACHADFIAADGHKWLLAPEGTGLFYCRKEHLEQLRLHQLGWACVEDRTNYDALFHTPAPHTWRLQHDARRFECGSLNNLGIRGLHASLQLLSEVGYAAISERITSHIDYLLDKIDRQKYESLTPSDAAARAGILTLRLRRGDSEALFQSLKERQVLCAYRGGGVRLSPHFYTPRSHLDRVLALLANHR